MANGLLKSFDEDMAGIPVSDVKGNTPRDRIMKLFAQVLLRLWTRLALESGQKLTMSPSQFVLGMYEGQMKWILNDAVDYKGIAQLSVSGLAKRRYSLVAETYVRKGEERVRMFFALEDQKVKNKPVYVNYLVYDVSYGEFDISAVVADLRLAMPKWLETITSGEYKPLWEYCDDKFECVGV